VAWSGVSRKDATATNKTASVFHNRIDQNFILLCLLKIMDRCVRASATGGGIRAERNNQVRQGFKVRENSLKNLFRRRLPRLMLPEV
jgi:hypothetical protein